MGNIIYYCLVYFAEALIIWQYCSGLFQSKYSKPIEISLCLILYSVPLIFSFQENIEINFITFISINFLYIILLYKSTWYIALFHASITTVLMGLTELISMSLFSELTYTFYKEDLLLHNFSILTVCSKLLYFIFLQLIVHIFGKSKITLQKYSPEITTLTLVSLSTGFTLVTFAAICINENLSSSMDHMIGISSFLLLIINIFIFGIYNYNQKKSQEFTELQIQYQKEYDTAEYYKMLIEQHENQSILIHDIKKHLNSISLLNQQGDSDAVNAYINQIITSPDLRDSVRVSDNKMLNAILSRYIRLCQDKGIDFRPDIRSECMDFIQDADLTALICNLLDNAVESASKQENSYIELSADKKKNTPFTLLTIINSCRTTPLTTENGSLITHKKDKLRHGYGVRSIKRIVHKYGGEIEMYYHAENTTFHTILTLKNLPN